MNVPAHDPLEIVCDDANVERLTGRANGNLSTAADGRTDVVFGQMYFATDAIDRASVRAVARAINNRQTGDPNGLTERLAESQDVEAILMDGT